MKCSLDRGGHGSWPLGPISLDGQDMGGLDRGDMTSV